MFILLVFHILVDFDIFLLHKPGLSVLQTACHTEVSSFFLCVCVLSTKIAISTKNVTVSEIPAQHKQVYRTVFYEQEETRGKLALVIIFLVHCYYHESWGSDCFLNDEVKGAVSQNVSKFKQWQLPLKLCETNIAAQNITTRYN